jgi:hypothetical protein
MTVFVKLRRGARKRLRSALMLAAVVVAVQPAPAMAESTAAEAGIGVASVLCSLVYGPVKIVYATLGTVLGGLAWGLSGGDDDVLQAVLLPAVRGDYVVTPANLRGREPLEFIGRRPGYELEVEVDDGAVGEVIEERY